jgi:hypothetical protein
MVAMSLIQQQSILAARAEHHGMDLYANSQLHQSVLISPLQILMLEQTTPLPGVRQMLHRLQLLVLEMEQPPLKQSTIVLQLERQKLASPITVCTM